MRPLGLLAAAIALAACVPMATAAEPTDPTTAAVFAGGNITFNSFSTVSGAPVVANGSVIHNGGSLNASSLYAGGTFTDAPAAFQNSTGDLLFGGSITGLGGPGSMFGGNITSGGSIAFLNSSEQVAGNVTAAGDVSQPFDFAGIGGSVLAGGNVNIQGTVTGGVTYGTGYTQGTFAHIGGAIVHGGAVTPTPYNALTLPVGRSLTPGASDVVLSNFQSITLAPGAYGNLDFASSNTVTLTAGQYIFAGISNSFALNQLAFDTSGGPINVFVAGDLDFNLVQVINGQALFAGGNPNPADSNQIFFEVGGSFTGDDSIYGTVFAPNGNITMDNFASDTGRLLAGGDVTINDGNVTYVPEPAALALFCSGALALLRRRKNPSRRHLLGF